MTDAEEILGDFVWPALLKSTTEEENRQVENIVLETTETGRKFDPKIIESLVWPDTTENRKKIVEILRQYLDINNTEDSELISQFHNSAGENGEGKWPDTSWCMSFVQYILREELELATKDIGSPTVRAREGTRIWEATKDPKPWDLVIVRRWNGGHIGFFMWFTEDNHPIIIWGNQGEWEVSLKEELRPVISYRSIEKYLTQMEGKS
jgi:hypothetical protein